MHSRGDGASAPIPPSGIGNLAEEAPVGICVVQDGRVVYRNRWLRELGGPGPADAAPLDELALIHPDDREIYREQLQASLAAGGRPPCCTVRLASGGGGFREVELYPTPVVHGGRPARQLTMIDISARVDAEHNLQEYACRLEESNRFRQLFGDILSHDLMSPVWVAENYLRLAMDGGVPDAKLSFYDGMRGALAKARVILTDARTYLRIQERVAYTGERIDLSPLVEGVAASLRPQWEEKRQSVALRLAPVAVISAGPMVKEIAWHLLSNAVKYGPAGSSIEVEVEVSAGQRVALRVRDQGPGVREEDRERIFRRFEHMEKGPIVGVGLGLAIARRLTELHGGRIWVEANPGGGSVFAVDFPAAGAPQA